MGGKIAKETPVADTRGGSGTKHKVTEQDKATLQLKTARDRLKKLRKRLDEESLRLQNHAAQYVKQGMKERALTALKIKKFKADEAEKCEAQLFEIASMIDNLEWSSSHVQVLNALKTGTDTLNKLHETMPLDKVMELLDDNAEAIKMGKEINDMIINKAHGTSGSGSVEYDDDALLLELQAIMETPTTPKSPSKHDQQKMTDLPDAPTHIPISSTNSAVKQALLA